jgi:hypothetical protein
MEEAKDEAQAAKGKALSDQKELDNTLSSFSSRSKISHRSASKLLKLYHEQKENDRILNLIKASQSVDLCFVLDATGSMAVADVFRALKENIRSLLTAIKDTSPYLDFQLSFVAYRDPEDEQHLEILQFTTSRTEFEDFVKGIEGKGGGDECEDVLGGLKAATELEWRFYNRILFLCGDAPCHGLKYHDGCGDSHPDGLRGLSSRKIMHDLVEKNVQMFFWKINDSTDKMIDKLNAEAATSSNAFPGERSRDSFIETIPIDTRNTAAIIRTVKDSLTLTATRSLTASARKAGKVKPKDFTNTFKHLETLHEGEEEDKLSRLLDRATLTPEGTLRTKGGSLI